MNGTLQLGAKALSSHEIAINPLALNLPARSSLPLEIFL
jgi:hypothetical protein